MKWWTMPNYYYVGFNGASSYIDCGSNASLDDIHTGNFTVDFWVNPRTPRFVHDGIIMKGDETTGRGWAVVAMGTPFPITNVTIYAYVNYPTVGTIRTVQSLTRGIWNHIAISYNHTGDRDLYEAINGSWCTYATQIASVGVAPSDAAYSLLLGATRITNITEFLLGDISWIRISDGIRWPIGVSFTPPEQCIPPDVDATTIELWALDEGVGVTTLAAVNPANNGTMTDCTWNFDCEVVPPTPPYDTIAECGGEVWIPSELLAPTGNVVTGVDVPFAVHEELAATGNTYFRVEDTPPVAGSDSPSYFGLWKPKRHS